MNLPAWAKIAIKIAWGALKAALSAAGVPIVVVAAIEEVLVHFGLLGESVYSLGELHDRANALRNHCSGVACAPELKG